MKSASEPQFRQGHPSSEDLTKNLFKIFCGIFNIRLRQQGINNLEDKLIQVITQMIELRKEKVVLLEIISEMKQEA